MRIQARPPRTIIRVLAADGTGRSWRRGGSTPPPPAPLDAGAPDGAARPGGSVAAPVGYKWLAPDDRFRFSPGSDPLPYLRGLLADDRDDTMREQLAGREATYDRYGRAFGPDNLAVLSAEEFTSFLYFENNGHWWGIHRHKAQMTADMERLRGGLAVLLGESRPILDRLEWLWPRSRPPVPGLGRAVATPILHVVHPQRYGVENAVAESAMSRLGLWPRRTGSRAGRYVAVNRILRETADRLGTDLWTLDALWSRVEREHTAHR